MRRVAHIEPAGAWNVDSAADHLRIRRAHVLEEMRRGLGV